MSLSWDIVVRYSFRGQRAGFSRLVARASMLGMVLGVASLITVMSVMNGFAGELHGRILSLVPHAVMTIDPSVIKNSEPVIEHIRAASGVTGIAPVMNESTLLQAWGRQRAAQMQGIDVDAQRDVSELHQHIVAGSLDALDAQAFSVALGSGLARLLGVRVGDSVEVVLPVLSVTPLGVFPRTRRLQVVAEFQVGADLDTRQAYVSMATAQRLFARQSPDGWQLQFADRGQAERAIRDLRKRLPQGVQLTDWRQSQGSLFTAVQMEKITVAVLLLAVVAVAAFNIVSTLTMSVTEKQRDIAVLRVLGLTAGEILMIFVGHGLLMGLVGIAIGTLLGVALALNISELAYWLESLSGSRLFDPSVYYIGRLPSVLEWGDVVVTVAAAIALSLGATLYPAWRASIIQPVEALNHG